MKETDQRKIVSCKSKSTRRSVRYKKVENMKEGLIVEKRRGMSPQKRI